MAKIMNFFTQVLGHELLVKAMGTLFDAGAKSAVKALESNLLGFGVNDESLFLSACAYAHLRLNVTKDQLSMIFEAMNLLEKGSRRKVVRTIGKSEQEVIVPVPVLKEDGTVALDKKGNAIVKEVKRVLNVRGGETIAMFAALNDLNKIKEALEASAATITAGKDIQDIWNIITPKLKQVWEYSNVVANNLSAVKQSADEYFHQSTKFEKFAKKIDIFGIMKLGGRR